MSTRLSILMDEFGISGKDLSGLLHIDSSLVSKWKSGKRHMKSNSTYISQLIDHVMELDRSNQYAKIRLMLSNDYMNIFKASENEISLFLKDWLTMSKEDTDGSHDYFEEIKNLKNASLLTTYSMSGEDGRRQAFNFFQKYAQQMSPNAEIWIYTTESERWMHEPEEYFDEWITRFLSLLADGNKIKVIHNVPGPVESVANSILAWLPMHLTGGTESFYIQRYKEPNYTHSFFIIKDEIAVYSWFDEPDKKDMNTYITHEPALLHDVQLQMKTFFEESGPIFQRYDFSMHRELINNIARVAESNSPEYQWGVLNSLCDSASMDLLREIVTENGFSESEIEDTVASVGIIADLAANSPRKVILNIQQIKENLQKDRVVISEVSFFCGKPVYASHDLYVKILLDGIARTMQNDNRQICIAGTPYLDRLGNTDIIVKEDTELHIRSIDGEKEIILLTAEPTIVKTLCRYLEELWTSTPYICRNKPYVEKQIKKLVDECERLREKDAEKTE